MKPTIHRTGQDNWNSAHQGYRYGSDPNAPLVRNDSDHVNWWPFFIAGIALIVLTLLAVPYLPEGF